MGGNALKRTKTVRLNSVDYRRCEEEILCIIQPFVLCSHIPRFFGGKDSFGDLDVLVCPLEQENFIEQIARLLDSKEIVVNGNVTSFEFKSFQVDIIQSSPEYFENHKIFLDYSDFGGILGQMLNQYDLKYGHEGLFFKIYNDHIVEHFISDLHLSSDPAVIFEFLNLNLGHFQSGFSSPQDLFQFLSSTKFCRCDSFSLDAINIKHRRRIKVRPVYQQFIAYLQGAGGHPDANEYMIRYQSDKSAYHDDLLRYFNRTEEYTRIMQTHLQQTQVREKYNGHIISQLTGLTHKELGVFMERFRSTLEDFNDYIIRTPSEVINRDVLEFYRVINE